MGISPQTQSLTPSPIQQDDYRQLLLQRNIRWFGQLRLYTLLMLALAGITSLYRPLMDALGLNLRPGWLLSCAVLLGLLNLAAKPLLSHSNKIRESSKAIRFLEVLLWTEIIYDLVVLTFVVYFVGSTLTFAPFAYLLHVVLACIFFSRIQSALIMLISLILYTLVVSLEYSGSIPLQTIIQSAPQSALWSLVQLRLNLSIFASLIVTLWFLASHLSSLLHERERDLENARQKMIQTQNEKSKHMLRTTHELKAPFAAIHANLQLLLKGYCGPLQAEATETILRTGERCQALSASIQKMLQLANLNSSDSDMLNWVRIDLVQMLKKVMDSQSPQIQQRRIQLQLEHPSENSAIIIGVEDHIQMMLGNLISNAVTYSHEGGQVIVSLKRVDPSTLEFSVTDRGIGISPEKIGKIFDEYYRTQEAAVHNKFSTGLGLAIVKHVSQTHHIQLSVQSTLHEGSTFKALIPAVP